VRIPLAAAVLVLAACTAPPPNVGAVTPSPEPGVVEVSVLLDLSGPRAAMGTEQRSAMELWRERREASGARPQVRLTFVDLAGSEARLFIELRRATVEQHRDAVVVGVPVTYDDVLGQATLLAAVPVLFTLPLDVDDPVALPGGRWAFALAPSLSHLAFAAITDATDRGVLVPSLVLVPADSERDRRERALAAEMRRRGRDPITAIPLPEGGAVPPVVRSSLSVLRSAHCSAALGACAAVAREARSAAAPTFFYLPYATTPAEMQGQTELASRAVWPATRSVVAPVTPEGEAFLIAMRDRFGPPGALAATAHDALSLLALAAGGGDASDAERTRAALERITIRLIATTYSFRPERHAGPDPDDLAYVAWSDGRVVHARPAALGTGLATPTPSPTPTAAPSP
jgi:hypothetical protein